MSVENYFSDVSSFARLRIAGFRNSLLILKHVFGEKQKRAAFKLPVAD